MLRRCYTHLYLKVFLWRLVATRPQLSGKHETILLFPSIARAFPETTKCGQPLDYGVTSDSAAQLDKEAVVCQRTFPIVTTRLAFCLAEIIQTNRIQANRRG